MIDMPVARDRVGICPLHWSQRGDWLYFGSEIKALFASAAAGAEIGQIKDRLAQCKGI